MAKFYSVYKGKSGAPKIFTSWDECKREVIGCKGAIYKSFKTMDEAKEFILLNSEGNVRNFNSSKPKVISEISRVNREEKDLDLNDSLVIYVDGSFSLEKGNFSYGLVATKNGEVIYEENGAGNDEKAVPLRNVSGEVLGSMKAVDYAINNGYKEVYIVYDYQGIESWALGTWKRNNEITSNYHDFMQKKMKEIKINFKKVKGHSGDKFNDRADILAKSALGI